MHPDFPISGAMQGDPSYQHIAAPILIYILDGGLGTTLKDEYQVEVDGTARPLWSSHLLISDPTKLLDVHRAFVDAGADIVLTATYQASIEGFARTSNPQDGRVGIPRAEAEGYMRSAVSLARASLKKKQSNGNGGKVALSMGAYGAVMVPSQEYTGKYDEGHMSVKQLRDWHKERLDVFIGEREVWKDVDMVAFETVPLLAEIEAVRETMWMTRQDTTDQFEKKAFWISCVFPGKNLSLPDGSPVGKVVRAMLGRRENAAIPYAIGINCTKSRKVAELLKEFEEAVERMIEGRELEQWPALVLYPDGTKGEVYNTSTHEWESPGNDGGDSIPWDQMVFNILQETKQRGRWTAILVGGCCKTTPEDIKNLKQRVDALHS